LQLELQERVAQVRKTSTTRLIGAAQTDVLLVLRTIGLASAARAPPTEAQLGLASSLLDELTRELARKRSYSDHRAAGRKRRDSWRRRLADVKAPEHEWAQVTCMICFTNDPVLAPVADLKLICAKKTKEAELELSKVKGAAKVTAEAAATRPACQGTEVEPEHGRANRRRGAAVAPQADKLLARLIEAGLPATVRWLVISQKECDAEDAKAGGGVWKATRRMVETAVRERLVAERATMGGVN
jgi:hypothetical protein